MAYIKTYGSITNDDLSLCGRKALNIAALSKNGLNVPSGFVIISSLFKEFIKSNNLIGKIEAAANNNDEKADYDRLEMLFLKAKFQPSALEEINDAYYSLGFDTKKRDAASLLETREVPVAVRSSYPNEHLFSDSKNQAIVNVKDEKGLLMAIKESYFSIICLNLDKRAALDIILNNGIAIIIQRKVPAAVKGAAFYKEKNHISVKAWFLEEEGKFFDEYIVRTDGLNIVGKDISDKAAGFTLDAYYKNKETDRQALSDNEIQEAARLVKKSSVLLGKEQLIDFAVFASQIFVLQSKDHNPKIETLGEEDYYTHLGSGKELYDYAEPAPLSISHEDAADIIDICDNLVTDRLEKSFIEKNNRKADSFDELVSVLDHPDDIKNAKETHNLRSSTENQYKDIIPKDISKAVSIAKKLFTRV